MKAWLFAMTGGLFGAIIVEYGGVFLADWQFYALLVTGLIAYKFVGRIIGL